MGPTSYQATPSRIKSPRPSGKAECCLSTTFLVVAFTVWLLLPNLEEVGVEPTVCFRTFACEICLMDAAAQSQGIEPCRAETPVSTLHFTGLTRPIQSPKTPASRAAFIAGLQSPNNPATTLSKNEIWWGVKESNLLCL